MCHAIITVKYKSTGTDELDTIKVETPEELDIWDANLQANDQVVSFRVYPFEYGRNRVSVWSTHVLDLASIPRNT